MKKLPLPHPLTHRQLPMFPDEELLNMPNCYELDTVGPAKKPKSNKGQKRAAPALEAGNPISVKTSRPEGQKNL